MKGLFCYLPLSRLECLPFFSPLVSAVTASLTAGTMACSIHIVTKSVMDNM